MILLRYFMNYLPIPLRQNLTFQVNKVHKITNGFTAFCTVHNSIICYLFSTNLVSISKFSLWLSHKVYFVVKYYINVNIYIFKVVYLSSKFNVSVFNSYIIASLNTHNGAIYYREFVNLKPICKFRYSSIHKL